jgi:amino acid transporter
MKIRLLQFLAIVSVALYLVPTGAHFFELTNKLALSPAEYMNVQKIYAGWSQFGMVIAFAILAIFSHTMLVGAHRVALALSVAALLGLVATQAIFWAFTYPMNVASKNWTVAPESFEAARRQWEYSHAASAVLTFASLLAIVLSALVFRDSDKDKRPRMAP